MESLKKKFENYNIEIRKMNLKNLVKKRRKKIQKANSILKKTGHSIKKWKDIFLKHEKNLSKEKNIFDILEILKTINDDITSNEEIDSSPIFLIFETKLINYLFFLLNNISLYFLEKKNYFIFFQKNSRNFDFIYNQFEKENNLEDFPLDNFLDNLQNFNNKEIFKILEVIFHIFSNLSSCEKNQVNILIKKNLLSYFLIYLSLEKKEIFQNILWSLTNLLLEFPEMVNDFEKMEIWYLIRKNINSFQKEESLIHVYFWFSNKIFHLDEFSDFIYSEIISNFYPIENFLNNSEIISNFVDTIQKYLQIKKKRQHRIQNLNKSLNLKIIPKILQTFPKTPTIISKTSEILAIISYEENNLLKKIITKNTHKIFEKLLCKIEQEKSLNNLIIAYYNFLCTSKQIFDLLFKEEILAKIIYITLFSESESVTYNSTYCLLVVLEGFKEDRDGLANLIYKDGILNCVFRFCKHFKKSILNIFMLIEKILRYNEEFRFIKDLEEYNFGCYFKLYEEFDDQDLNDKIFEIKSRFGFKGN